MRKYSALASVIIFILTILILEMSVVGKVAGSTGTNLLLFGFGAAVLLAAWSEKGRLKTIVLSLYGLLVLYYGFISELIRRITLTIKVIIIT